MNRRVWTASLIIGSFAVMVLGLPLAHWLHLPVPIVCPFRTLTGIPCPTCGYIRACELIARGQFGAAVAFQPFVLVIVGLSAIAAVKASASLYRKTDLEFSKYFLASIWLALGFSWVWNLTRGI